MRPIIVLPILLLLAGLLFEQKPKTPVRTAIKAVPKVVPHVVPRVRPNAKERSILLFTDVDNCQPCRRMDPIIRDLIGEGLPIEEHNPNIETSFASQWGVSKTPTFIVLKAGKEITRHIGELSRKQIEEFLDMVPDQVVNLIKTELPAKPLRSVLTKQEPYSPSGWRLRLFYPAGDKTGEKLRDTITKDLPQLAEKYTFWSLETDDPQFQTNWRPYGYPKDAITLVLIRPDRTRAYYRHLPPTAATDLERELKTAAEPRKQVMDDCTCKFYTRK